MGSPSSPRAQSDPFAPPGFQDSTTGTSDAGTGTASALRPQNTPQPGSIQSTAPSDDFNPTVVPNYTAHNQGDFSDTSQQQPVGAPRPAGSAGAARPLPPPLSEFEKYVAERAGHPLPRFGAASLLNGARGFATSPTTTVPPDYTLNPGDVLLIGVTGAVEADLQLTVDSEGHIFIPRVGSVSVAGVRYGDLAAALQRRFNSQYKRVNVSVVIGHVHGLTVYVTGYAVNPGAYTVSSLSTMVDAVIAAGGPSGGGSFRIVQLRRGGQLVSTLDLYELLLKGDKSHDVSLLNGDVLNVEPVGPELAITGSVNQEAIYEAKPGETLGDIIAYAGGPNSLADDSRVLVARLADLDKAGSEVLTFAAARAFPAERGDVVRILSQANIARPLERQAILATIEGEIDHPGRYYLRPGATVGDLLAQAGGLTGGAFIYGTEVNRDSLRQQQQASFDRAIADLQLTAAAEPLSGLGTISADRAAISSGRAQAALAIIDRLKERKPEGRLVLALPPDATALPVNLTLENNDRIFVPPRPKTVGVFGAVYQTGSFLFAPTSRIDDYLKLSGGPERIADRSDIFVVRANGSVLSMHQDHDLRRRPALPGDVIFVPIHTGPSLFEKLLVASQVIAQFGVNILTLHAVGAF